MILPRSLPETPAPSSAEPAPETPAPPSPPSPPSERVQLEVEVLANAVKPPRAVLPGATSAMLLVLLLLGGPLASAASAVDRDAMPAAVDVGSTHAKAGSLAAPSGSTQQTGGINPVDSEHVGSNSAQAFGHRDGVMIASSA